MRSVSNQFEFVEQVAVPKVGKIPVISPELVQLR